MICQNSENVMKILLDIQTIINNTRREETGVPSWAMHNLIKDKWNLPEVIMNERLECKPKGHILCLTKSKISVWNREWYNKVVKEDERKLKTDFHMQKQKGDNVCRGKSILKTNLSEVQQGKENYKNIFNNKMNINVIPRGERGISSNSNNSQKIKIGKDTSSSGGSNVFLINNKPNDIIDLISTRSGSDVEWEKLVPSIHNSIRYR